MGHLHYARLYGPILLLLGIGLRSSLIHFYSKQQPSDEMDRIFWHERIGCFMILGNCITAVLILAGIGFLITDTLRFVRIWF